MLTLKTKKKLIIVAIALASVLGFAGTNSADLSPLFKGYGILLTCQIGFLLFFVQQIFSKRRVS